MKRFPYIFILSLLAVLTACEKNVHVTTYHVEQPVLSSFTPTEGEMGTVVTIRGSHLTRVDSVLIGGGKAGLLYRVSDNEVVAEVTTSSRSGVVAVYNEAGVAATTAQFTILYPQPTVDTYPTKATVGDQMVVTGTNLHLITAVRIDTITATLISQQKTELVFTVPYYDSDEPLSLRFNYFDGTQETAFGPEGATFTVNLVAPQIEVCPDALTKYSPIQMTGTNMDLIDTLYIGSIKADIRLKNSTMIEFDVPSNYFDGPFTADLRAIYYKRKSMLIKSDFQVISDPNEPRYNVYKNITLSARSQSGGSDMPFFDADQGLVISTCEAEENMMGIDFLLYDNSGYAQLYSPSNATNTLKNFKCDGVSITATNPAAWSASTFYGIDTKFRILDPANTTHKAVIDAYEAGTIVKLDDALTGISQPSSKAPKVYATDNGSSNLSAETYRYAWVRNFTTGKNGIIKILSVESSDETGKTHTITFDIIWEK